MIEKFEINDKVNDELIIKKSIKISSEKCGEQGKWMLTIDEFSVYGYHRDLLEAFEDLKEDLTEYFYMFEDGRSRNAANEREFLKLKTYIDYID